MLSLIARHSNIQPAETACLALLGFRRPNGGEFNGYPIREA